LKLAGLIDDLFFTSKFREIAKSLGSEAVVCRSAASLPNDAARVVVDLSATTFDPIAEIANIKSGTAPRPVTAFFSHVQIDMKERAERAGADEVIPRSAFARRLAELISAAPSSSEP